MIVFIEIFFWLQLLFSLLYLIIIAVFTYGWFTLKQNGNPKGIGETKASVIVAVRNEAENIKKLLDALLNQSCDLKLFEVIMVDDHSEDNTVKLIQDFAASHAEIDIKLLHSAGTGKKQAVSRGIEYAVNNLIITTDGDCVPGRQWIAKMAGYFEKHQPRIILGPVVYMEERGLLQQLFSLDFISLVASGAGSAGAGLPFMGNAANMAFDKSVFSSDSLKEDFSSGDDVFLIHAVKKQYGSRSIHFLKDAQALVTTRAPSNWSVFLNQRLRWASKAKGYHDFWSQLVSWSVLLFNIGLALLFTAGFFWRWMWVVWMLFIALKAFIDFPLLSGYAQLTGKSKQLVYLWPMEFIYPFYVVMAGIGSLFVKYRWKGREGLK